ILWVWAPWPSGRWPQELRTTARTRAGRIGILAILGMPPVGNTRLVERLVADGLITPEQQEATLNLVARSGERVEEALLESNAIDELGLLKYLAALHKTRFVSTEKLSKADIDRLTLDKVPKKLAERDNIFPVLFDAQSGVLSVVTPD